MYTLLQDLRYAARMLVRTPAFTAIAVLTLGLGIGANTAIFSIVNAVLLRPLPYKDADRLVRIVQHDPQAELAKERRDVSLNQEHFLQWRARTRTLSHLAVFDRYTMTLTGRVEPARLAGAAVSPALFPMLGASPEIGRGFDDADERPSGRKVVVLSYQMWQRYFGLDPGIVGRIVALDGRAHTVTGVMPASFEFPDKQTLFWTPFVITPPVQIPGGGEVIMVQAIGRLKDGVSLDQATAEANTPAVIAGLPGRIELLRLKDELVAPFRPALTILLASVGFVLLIACAKPCHHFAIERIHGGWRGEPVGSRGDRELISVARRSTHCAVELWRGLRCAALTSLRPRYSDQGHSMAESRSLVEVEREGTRVL